MVLCKNQPKIQTAIDRPNEYLLESNPDFRLRIFTSLADLPDDWERAQPADNVFLQRPYLTAVEKNPPLGYEFAYLVFYRNETPLGVCYCQLLEFKTGGSIREEVNNSAFAKATRFFKGFLIKKLSIKTLICGNALLTGEHAFHFASGIKEEKQFALVADAMKSVRAFYDASGEKINGFLLKDFTDASLKGCGEFVKRGFHRVNFQPNMVLYLREDWKTFDDYLAAKTAKYRTRAKSSFKKGKTIVKQNFNAERIKHHHARIFELYQSIEEGAGFSFAHLHKGYFCGLKDALGDDFNLTGYWLDDRLIGFYTTIKNGHETEAHFLGFDHNINRSHRVYHNMLFDMVREAITNGSKSLIFARTALEIKSSVGAVAEEMHCYTRHWNDLPNRLVPKIFEYLNPVEEWTPRNPFKDGEAGS